MKNRIVKAYMIGIGNVNSVTGQTIHDWNIYDETHPHTVYLVASGSRAEFHILVAAPNTFKIGDYVAYFSNEGRNLGKGSFVISLATGPNAIKAMFGKFNVKLVNPRSFMRSTATSLEYSYSVKGTEYMEETDKAYKKTVKHLNFLIDLKNPLVETNLEKI